MDFHNMTLTRDSIDYNGLHLKVEKIEDIVTIDIEADALDFKA